MRFTATVLFCAALAASAALSPEAIWVNGAIVTMDPAGRTVQAVAVRNGEIIAAGSTAEIRKLAGPSTRVTDLRGKAMLPGFYSPHDHFPGSGTTAVLQVDLNSPPIGRIQSIDGLMTALKERARSTPPGQWIVGRGYDDTLLREKRHPTRADLDRVSTQHPIWIIHTSGHLGVANSRALETAKITRDTPKPKSGVIRKDASGEPNGVFEECGGLVSRHIPAHTEAQRMEAIRWANRDYLSKGVTTSVLAGAGAPALADLRKALDAGILRLRILAMLSPAVAKTPAEAAKLGVGERIRTGPVKMFQDGSIQGYTGYLSAPYYKQPAGQSDYRGYSNRSREELTEAVKRFHRAGFQIAIHANGDAAIDDVLYAYREAQREFPRHDARHRIEHCQTAREDQLDAMRELGVTPSFFAGHVFFWGDRHRDIFLGPVRGARISPLSSAHRRGIRFTVHDDTPVTPVNPLHSVWVAVNRTTRDGQVLGPEFRIPVLEALRAVTSDAAWQNFEEKRKGSIEPGKLADFVILDRNPLTVPPAEIGNLRVLETIVGGETVYTATAWFPPPDSAGGWRTADPAEAGMDAKALDNAFEYIQGSTKHGGLLVVRHGRLVYERYFGRAARDVTPNTASCGKTFTSIAMGILMAERPELFTNGLDQEVYTPRYLPPEAFPLNDPRKAKIRLGQLLSMTAGLRGNSPGYVHGKPVPIEHPGLDGWQAMVEANAFASSMWCDPGEGYSYATSSPHIVSAIIRHTTGMELEAFIRSRLAEPLGWGRWNFGYQRPEVTHTPGGGGIALRATDMLRFAYLLLHEGNWNGRQIVPASYVHQCARPSPYNPHFPYSLQTQLTRDGYYKQGSGGHAFYVVPSLDMVIWKIGGRDDQYPANALDDGSRKNWKRTVSDDAAVLRTLELVTAAVTER